MTPRADDTAAATAPRLDQGPHCGGRLRLIATVHDPAVIRKLLARLGMTRSGPNPGHAPPESDGVGPMEVPPGI
jgi:hypothetical protein